MNDKSTSMREGADSGNAASSRTAPTNESQSQHTPGPWVYRPLEFDDWGFVRAEKGSRLVARAVSGQSAKGVSEHRRDGTDPYEANGRLIAAAPDLLAALKAIADDDGEWSDGDGLRGDDPAFLRVQAIAKAAIQKAEAK